MFEEVDEVLPADPANDWKKFFLTDSNGIRKTGQLLLQKAVEAYVYCVVSAQAGTRWRIVGEGAKSLQTQEAFAKLAKETVAEDDDTVLISNAKLNRSNANGGECDKRRSEPCNFTEDDFDSVRHANSEGKNSGIQQHADHRDEVDEIWKKSGT